MPNHQRCLNSQPREAVIPEQGRPSEACGTHTRSKPLILLSLRGAAACLGDAHPVFAPVDANCNTWPRNTGSQRAPHDVKTWGRDTTICHRPVHAVRGQACLPVIIAVPVTVRPNQNQPLESHFRKHFSQAHPKRHEDEGVAKQVRSKYSWIFWDSSVFAGISRCSLSVNCYPRQSLKNFI